MSTTITYHCPNCSAGLVFDPEKQLFRCDFCLSDFTREQLQDLSEEPRENAESEKTEAENEAFCKHMNAYVCPDCGAEIMSDENTAADTCLYCHNPVILSGRLKGHLKPDKIIPFRYDKAEAQNKFKNHIKKHWFLPRDFSSDATLEKLGGVYYPFWVTDADAYGTLDATGYSVRQWRSGDTEYTETSRYAVRRGGDIHFEDISTCALSTEDKEMLEGILPFPSDSLKDFSMPYLSGFVAKKRDLERSDVNSEVERRMNTYGEQILRRTISGYSSVSVHNCRVDAHRTNWDYTLMPLWMLVYKHKNKSYTYAMNGYTGKIYGELPLSFGKLAILFGAIVILGTVLISLLGGALL